MQFVKSLLDLIFPPRCEVCRTIGPDEFCENCAKKITFLKPSAFIHSVGAYEGTLKSAILRFKFKKKISIAEPLGILMVKYLSRHLDMNNIDFLVPVPLHITRFKQRGFNQSELLGHSITKYYDIPTVSGLLFRTRETHPQFDLPLVERFKNVRGAFEVKGSNLLKGKNILLLDDIYTTGSTVSECTRVLKESGANNVHVLTLSRAF
jgi:ComF family protein